MSKIMINGKDCSGSIKVDQSLNASSTNAISNKAVYDAIQSSGGGGGGSITVDETLSTTSSNPIANKAVATALNSKQDKLTIDSAVIQDSNNPVSSSAVYRDLMNQQTEILPTVATLTSEGLRGDYTLFSYSVKGNKNGFSFLVDNSGTVRAIDGDDGSQFYIAGDLRNLITSRADYSLYQNIELITRNALSNYALKSDLPILIYNDAAIGATYTRMNFGSGNFKLIAYSSDGGYCTGEFTQTDTAFKGFSQVNNGELSILAQTKDEIHFSKSLENLKVWKLP